MDLYEPPGLVVFFLSLIPSVFPLKDMKTHTKQNRLDSSSFLRERHLMVESSSTIRCTDSCTSQEGAPHTTASRLLPQFFCKLLSGCLGRCWSRLTRNATFDSEKKFCTGGMSRMQFF